MTAYGHCLQRCEAKGNQLATCISQTMSEATDVWESAVHDLVRDRVNSTAALQVRPSYASTMVYPLHVLLEAAGRATSIPAIFFVDIVSSLVHSVLNKTSCVKLGRWRSRSRHWWVGTATVGEGKSFAMKDLVDDLVSVLEARTCSMVTYENEGF